MPVIIFWFRVYFYETFFFTFVFVNVADFSFIEFLVTYRIGYICFDLLSGFATSHSGRKWISWQRPCFAVFRWGDGMHTTDRGIAVRHGTRIPHHFGTAHEIPITLARNTNSPSLRHGTRFPHHSVFAWIYMQKSCYWLYRVVTAIYAFALIRHLQSFLYFSTCASTVDAGTTRNIFVTAYWDRTYTWWWKSEVFSSVRVADTLPKFMLTWPLRRQFVGSLAASQTISKFAEVEPERCKHRNIVNLLNFWN